MGYDYEYHRARLLELRANGLCRDCKADSPGSSYCAKCRERRSVATPEGRAWRKQYMRLKREELSAAGICTACGVRKCGGGRRCDECLKKRREKWETERGDRPRRAQRLCSLCREAGHNKRVCSKRFTDGVVIINHRVE